MTSFDTSVENAARTTGVPEDDTLGKCCCAAVRTDGSDAGDCGVAVVLGAGEANVLLDTLVLRVPDVREDGGDGEGGGLGRCWVTLPPFRVPRAHFSVSYRPVKLSLSLSLSLSVVCAHILAPLCVCLSVREFKFRCAQSSTAKLWSLEGSTRKASSLIASKCTCSGQYWYKNG
jgi:hypothetical protein